MSWLAPLYILGGLAIAIPLWLHWIQKSPRGEQLFSSVIFLLPSMPRSQRRNRLNNLWLLLLRGLALALLATAFARPFLKKPTDDSKLGVTRFVAICVDRSASMQRMGLWEQTQRHFEDSLASLGPQDQVAFFVFDTGLESQLGWTSVTPQTIAMLRDLFAKQKPAYRATDLGQALIDVLGRFPADPTDDDSREASDTTSSQRSIIVISDLAEGSRCDALESYRWPADVAVDLRRVDATSANASLRIVTDQDAMVDDPQAIRVRVAADGNLPKEVLHVRWSREASGEANRSVPNPAVEVADRRTVQLPAGGSRVLALPPALGSTCLVLEGDQHEFDNRWYVANDPPYERTLAYVGANEVGPDSLLYYLQRVELSTPQRRVELQSYADLQEFAGLLDAQTTPLCILEQTPQVKDREALNSYLKAGGRILLIARQDTGDAEVAADSDSTSVLAEWLGTAKLRFEDVECEDYVLWSGIDYKSELFQPFNDPKFNDFSKIRVWRYRRPRFESTPTWTVLARFDDQSPALVSKSIGEGTLFVLMTSWRPADSQLALSTKFVPLLALWFGSDPSDTLDRNRAEVGDPIDLQRRGPITAIVRPDGVVRAIRSEETSYRDTDLPGIYRLQGASEEQQIAVNLDPAESRTHPLKAEELTRLGIHLQAAENAGEQLARKHQRRDVELESLQSWWRWLLIACMTVLACETYLAGRIDRVAMESTT